MRTWTRAWSRTRTRGVEVQGVAPVAIRNDPHIAAGILVPTKSIAPTTQSVHHRKSVAHNAFRLCAPRHKSEIYDWSKSANWSAEVKAAQDHERSERVRRKIKRGICGIYNNLAEQFSIHKSLLQEHAILLYIVDKDEQDWKTGLAHEIRSMAPSGWTTNGCVRTDAERVAELISNPPTVFKSELTAKVWGMSAARPNKAVSSNVPPECIQLVREAIVAELNAWRDELVPAMMVHAASSVSTGASEATIEERVIEACIMVRGANLAKKVKAAMADLFGERPLG